MSHHPVPTIVVGVGGAGVDIVTKFAEGDDFGWGINNEEYFELVAIDSDLTNLQDSPDDVTTISLKSSEAERDSEHSLYPYLTTSILTAGPGADRQRPVGRYQLESCEQFFRCLAETIEGMIESLLQRDGRANIAPRRLNIFHVHALGGGTGSGTFPIIAHALNEITQKAGLRTYTAGVGIVSEIRHRIGDGFDAIPPAGDCRYYANTYAGLRDLEKLLSVESESSLPIYDYSRADFDTNAQCGVDLLEPQACIDTSLYQHYFLVGVDEGRMEAVDRTQSPETYRTAVDNTIMAAIYGISIIGDDTVSEFSSPADIAHFGMFGQSQLSIPIKKLERYCDLSEQINQLEHDDEASESEIQRAYAEKEEVIDSLTTGAYGSRLGLLALDEAKLRGQLDRETLEEELTSLSAFHEEGYLARDLYDVMRSRIRQAYAWNSPLFTWSRKCDFETIGERARSVRDVWMIHSDENAALPKVDIFGIGTHRFVRSAESDSYPSLTDPYTVQFLTYTLDSPLSSLRVYEELDTAVNEERLDSILYEWNDYRMAFAYPEWYGREIRQYFGIRTAVTVYKLPELDIEKVNIEKDGSSLITWLSSHGLASYLWLADEWNRYNGFISTHGTELIGWKNTLKEYGLEYYDLREIVPNGEPVEKWFVGDLTWDELLAEIERRFTKFEGIRMNFIIGY